MLSECFKNTVLSGAGPALFRPLVHLALYYLSRLTGQWPSRVSNREPFAVLPGNSSEWKQNLLHGKLVLFYWATALTKSRQQCVCLPWWQAQHQHGTPWGWCLVCSSSTFCHYPIPTIWKWWSGTKWQVGSQCLVPSKSTRYTRVELAVSSASPHTHEWA